MPQAQVIVLDALRKQRHLSDYSGDTVPEATASECLTCAQELQTHVVAWLKKRHPALV